MERKISSLLTQEICKGCKYHYNNRHCASIEFCALEGLRLAGINLTAEGLAFRDGMRLRLENEGGN
jgi:hypothetical protein